LLPRCWTNGRNDRIERQQGHALKGADPLGHVFFDMACYDPVPRVSCGFGHDICQHIRRFFNTAVSRITELSSAGIIASAKRSHLAKSALFPPMDLWGTILSA